jgi:recombination protein RecA
VSAPGISILGALFLMKKVWKYARKVLNLYTKLTIMAKAVKQPTDSGVSKFQEALDKLNKAYGAGTVLALDSKTDGHYDVFSTGSIGFDWITLGTGGFVKGKLYELMGWEGTGKSTICGHAVAECQKKGGRVVYIDGEHAVDKKYFEAIGVNTAELFIAQPSNGEEGFNIAMEMMVTGEVDMVIIDSDSSLIPKRVVDGEVGESSIGYKARLNSNAYPKLHATAARNNVCVIVISQYREKIGVMFGNPTTTQGGHALKFYSDCRIEVSKTAVKNGDVQYGNLTKVKATKNKMSSPFRLSTFEIVYGQGIDKVKEIMDLLNDLELGRKYGQTMTFNDVKYNLEEFKTMLLDNEKFYNEIKDSIVNKINNIEIKVEENEPAIED